MTVNLLESLMEAGSSPCKLNDATHHKCLPGVSGSLPPHVARSVPTP
ncbi:hypothetical protein SAMN02745857_03297 [Andreprevotia lacus DSM 23236]|jgi:hypothetical protein|uniref:Uncharacterized protein n=1 Tax=Andreprevotia lacus DSM 23236 TaxID=1121001 RepID=A0A1W1XXE1_9NEIS|nr:hypothetical protein SAMN02745857_03297 [Andreprevotia lacus DSM 23236]